MQLNSDGKYPARPGYYISGFTMRFWHKRAKRYIYAPPGKPFPIWRKIGGARTAA